MSNIKANVYIPGAIEPISINLDGPETAQELIEFLIQNKQLSGISADYVVTFKNQLLSHSISFAGAGLQANDRIYITKKIAESNNIGIPSGGWRDSKNYDQLALLVLDNSGSMSEPGTGLSIKAEEVNQAVQGLINRLKDSSRKQNFSIACIAFDTTAEIVTDITAVSNANPQANYSFVQNFGGGTEIACGLHLAREIVKRFFAMPNKGDYSRSAVVIVMSDGMCQEPARTMNEANLLKLEQNTEIFSTYFKGPGDNDAGSADLLKNIASQESNFTETYDAKTLREFFMRSISEAGK